MNECVGKNYVLNGELNPAESFDNSLVYEGDSIYEVIRIVKGSPVFFHDHMERLATSVKLKQKKLLASSVMLKNDIKNLIRSDKKKETNIKIVFNFNNGSANYLVYYIEPIYPTEEQYKKGVKGILFFAERKDPGSKVIDHKLRSSIYHKLIHDGGYEALLVNEDNLITEGSRSNIFFMKENRLVSAPDKYVLSGITRKIILEICRENGIKVESNCVKPETISEYDAVFMTGTSPMVLPFNSIGDTFFSVKLPLIAQLRKLYMQKMEESILRFRSE
jgi:branched-chain amino acid aminotransferase